MRCYYHHEADAIGTCVSCGRAVCDQCGIDVQGKLMCRECLAQGKTGQPDPSEISDNDRMMGLLSYVVTLIVPAIILLSETGKARPFQRYHAVQSLAVSVAVFVISLLVGCIVILPFAVVLELVTGGVGTCCLIPVTLLPYVPMVYYGVRAYQGEYAVVPVLTDFLVQQGWVEQP
jgi:uncharacterized membrane protein